MAKAKGYLTRAAFKKGADWTTPVLCGAGDEIEIVSEGLTTETEFIADESLSGSVAPNPGDPGNEKNEGPITCECKYQGLEVLIAQAVGSAGAPVRQGTTLAYKHTFRLADDVEGIFGTLALLKTFEVWEYASAKVGGFTLTLEQNQRAKIELPFLAHRTNRNVGTGTNTPATFAAVTLPTVREFLTFAHADLRLNAQGGAALAGTDEVFISGFSLSFSRNLEGDRTTRYPIYIEEPLANGKATLEGSFSVPSYASEHAGLMSALQTKAPQKMLLAFTGPVCDGAYPYAFNLYLNNVQLVTGTPNVSGPGKVPLEVKFQAATAVVAPAGFPDRQALVIEIVNRRGTNALA
jgi:hypothetical protein